MKNIPVPIIIVGQPKAGTSSLFTWLAQHNQICASKIKETRYFIDKDYPLKHSNNGQISICEYLKFFDYDGQKYILEATPDYLYNKLPLKVHLLFEDVVIIIVKRDPIERLVSAFRYLQQQGIFDKYKKFDEYIFEQIQQKHDQNRSLHLRTLEQCSEIYINDFKKEYNENCIIVDFEELTKNPINVVHSLYKTLKLEPLEKENQEYFPVNKTLVSRNQRLSRIYRKASGFTRRRLRDHKNLRKILRSLSNLIRKILYKNDQNQICVSREIIQIIETEIRCEDN